MLSDVGQCRLSRMDHKDLRAVLPNGLANAEVKDGQLFARVESHDQDCLRFLHIAVAHLNTGRGPDPLRVPNDLSRAGETVIDVIRSERSAGELRHGEVILVRETPTAEESDPSPPSPLTDGPKHLLE